MQQTLIREPLKSQPAGDQGGSYNRRKFMNSGIDELESDMHGTLKFRPVYGKANAGGMSL